MKDELKNLISGKKLLLMDFDGTIADTEPLNFLTLKKLLAMENVDFTEEHFKMMVGKNAFEYLDLINKIFGKNYTAENEGRRYIEMFKDVAHENDIPYFEYIKELLAAFSNTRKVILSNQSDDVIKDLLARWGIDNEFEDVISCFVKKVKKQNYYTNIREFLGVEPNEVVLFEDSQRYLDFGRNAGFSTVGVINRYNNGNLNADVIIKGQ